MIKVPEIRGPTEDSDFHDSSLVDLSISPQLDTIRIVVSTPDEHAVERLWTVACTGVLRLEFESLGSGEPISCSNVAPLGSYTIYNDPVSDEQRRWAQRLEKLGVSSREARSVRHLVLASSFVCGWEEYESLEGVHIICRQVEVSPAPPIYKGMEFRQPRIEAGP